MKTAAIVTINLVLLAGAAAQDGPRDPMQPPPTLRPAAAPGGTATEPAPLVARHLMVIDGVRYVIDGGRRRGVGDLLGGARIERIEDSAVVVRNGRQLQRLPLFAGVVKRPLVEPVPGPSPVAASATTHTHTTATATADTGIGLADTPKRTAQAPTACADRPPCMQRPGEPR